MVLDRLEKTVPTEHTNSEKELEFFEVQKRVNQILNRATTLLFKLITREGEQLSEEQVESFTKELETIRSVLFTPQQLLNKPLPRSTDPLQLQDVVITYIEEIRTRLLSIIEDFEKQQLSEKLDASDPEIKRKIEIRQDYERIKAEFEKVKHFNKIRQALLRRKSLVISLLDFYFADFAAHTRKERAGHQQEEKKQQDLAKNPIPGRPIDPTVINKSMTTHLGMTDQDFRELRSWIRSISRKDIHRLAKEHQTGPLSTKDSKQQAELKKFKHYSRLLDLLYPNHQDGDDITVTFESQATLGNTVLRMIDPEQISNDNLKTPHTRFSHLVTQQIDEFKEKRKAVFQQMQAVTQSMVPEEALKMSQLERFTKSKTPPGWKKFWRYITGKKEPNEINSRMIAKNNILVLLKKLAIENQAGDVLDILIATLISIQEQYELLEQQSTPHHAIEELVLKKPFFAVYENNVYDDVFVRMYDYVATVGMVVDHSYDPDTIARLLSKISIIQAFQAARFRDDSGYGANRTLVGSLIRDYLNASLSLVLRKEPPNLDHIEILLNKFWINEVGRPSTIFQRHPETNQILYDQQGLPKVEALHNEFLTGSLTTTEYATFPVNQEINKEVLDSLKNVEQPYILASFIQKQLDMMINQRRNRPIDEIGVYDCPLPQRRAYSVVVVRNNQWKKIIIAQSEIEQASNRRLIRTLDTQISTPEGYKDLPDDLDKEVENSFDNPKGYDQIEPEILDTDNFSAADFRVVLTDNSELGQMDHWHNNVLANTFQGKTQAAYLFGEEDGYIKSMAANVCHRYIDGMEFRNQFSTVCKATFRDVLMETHRQHTDMSLLGDAYHNQSNAEYVLPSAIEYYHLLRSGTPLPKQTPENSDPYLSKLYEIKAFFEEEGISELALKQQILEEIIKQQQSLFPQTKRLLPKQEKLPVLSNAESHYSHIREARISENEVKLRARSNTLFNFYSEKFGHSIDRNSIVQMAIMITLKTEHSHFLESKNGLLAPAICVLSDHLQEAILDPQKYVLNPDLILEASAQAQLMKLNREAIKNKHFDPIRVLAVLPGLHSSSHKQREAITKAGLLLNEAVAGKAGDTCLVSSVTGSRKPLAGDGFTVQSKFGTAFSDVYMNMAVIGVTDYLSSVDEELVVTQRHLATSGSEQFSTNHEFAQELTKNIQAVLQFFEHGMKAFSESPSVTDQEKVAWLDFVRSEEYDQQIEAQVV